MSDATALVRRAGSPGGSYNEGEEVWLMRRMLGGVVAAAALVLVGCGPSGDEPAPEVTTLDPGGPTDESTEPVEPTSEPTAEEDDPTTGAASQEEWDERFAGLSDAERGAVDDLAERLSTRYYEISPEPLEAVTWPDGALGCPQPGQSYSQALVDGYRLILGHAGESYAYHAGEDGELSYCAQPGDPVDDGREIS